MNVVEHALTFDCDGETLVGVVSLPETPGPAATATASATTSATTTASAVVIVVGGPQYRAGSHRQFVHLARSLAAQGHPVLRFDYRGMGDSTGGERDFEDVTADIGAAITALRAQVPGIARVVLLGLCDGASAALLYCDRTQDARVTGLCLLNPWVRSEATLARTHVRHYYARRFMERAFWFKLLRGGVAIGPILRTLRLAGAAQADDDSRTFQQRMLRGWQDADRQVLLLLSGDDYTAREFIDLGTADSAWSDALQRRGVTRHDLSEADHTFSSAIERHRVERLTADWLAASSSTH